MAQPSIHIDGLKELNRQLRQVKSKELDNELKDIHKELAEEIIRRALPNVPVRTGRLKQSVRSSGTKQSAIGRAGRKSVPYAPAIHWGWPKRGIPRRPFLTDAADAVEKGVVDDYEDAVRQMLNRVIKGKSV